MGRIVFPEGKQNDWISEIIIKNKKDVNKKSNKWDSFWDIKPIEENDIDEFYETLTSLIAEIEHLNKDIKKSIK